MSQTTQSSATEVHAYGNDVPTLLVIESGSVFGLLEESPGMMRVEHASTVSEGLAHLVRHPVRAVPVDMSLPECRTSAP
jgi:hypothetical protein